MKDNRDKDLYRELRKLSLADLWEREVPDFNRAGEDRINRVAVIRAVGVVVSEQGSPEQKQQAREWLRGLLNDPAEKIRRYAVNALPKLEAAAEEEGALLALLKRSDSETEKKFIREALEKIGGPAALREISTPRLQQKVEAAREEGSIRFETAVRKCTKVQLHCRAGLEGIVAEEAAPLRELRFISKTKGRVLLEVVKPISLRQLFSLRCFAFVGFPFPLAAKDSPVDAICSEASVDVFEALTEGPIRYRLEFVGKGHQRAGVRELAEGIFAKRPNLLNTPSQPLWTIAVSDREIELRPRVSPDPRFGYRQDDVPAASHPPLAACMARLAGAAPNEIVWDPFCGSGLELIERSLLGSVSHVFGTDRSSEAVSVAGRNFAAALGASVKAEFRACDFRAPGFTPTLIITNPPLGRRVPIPDLRGMIQDLLFIAEKRLQRGGRLVFVNPLPMDLPQRSLKRVFQQKIDLGGFQCRLEKYLKQ